MKYHTQFFRGLWDNRKMMLPVLFGVGVFAVAHDLYLSAAAQGPDAAQVALPFFVFNMVVSTLLMLTYGLLLIRTSYVDFRNTLDGEKSVFVRMAADALRTPLTSMRWTTEILLDDELGSMNEIQRQSITKMRFGIERLIRLVNELLKIMKLSGGIIHYLPHPVQAKDILRGALQSIEGQTEMNKQKLSVNTDQNVSVQADLPLLQHVLQVLLSYASHLATPGSPIQVALQTDTENVSFVTTFQSEHVPLRSIDQDISDAKDATDWGKEDSPDLAVSREILAAAKGSMHVSTSGNMHTLSIKIPRHFSIAQ